MEGFIPLLYFFFLFSAFLSIFFFNYILLL
nr:MAG TPA: hypothetical protein [Caudoviricetes sp.]